MASIPEGVRFGAAYYTEYQPYERLKTDLDLMVEAGINTIRVGESVWSTWEPRDGEFNLEWLAPVLDAAHERGIEVIIGTPTYAVPPWLRRKYPETSTRTATGVEQPYGMRQDIDADQLTVSVLVPPNTTASVRLPEANWGTNEVGSVLHSFSCRFRPAAQDPRIPVWNPFEDLTVTSSAPSRR